ncbi:polygalacturonase-like [Diabrotica virgifera virgifera]|uniref:endo-polygalacturonase n=1 Tax=Diabrotica virgifera virgifera TaxID=50390 RepID=A0ABM5JZ20_DIAVI|nr:polygalacturonase-like [Diabrotica virgifera virgifera]
MLFIYKILVLLIVVSIAASDICTISNYDQVDEALSSCKDIVISNLTVPSGKTLNLNLKERSTVTFDGVITFEVSFRTGFLVSVAGKNVLVQGAPGSILNGQGEKYWDGFGDNGVVKPKFFRVATSGGSIFRNIYLLNCPHFCVGVYATDVTLTGWTIDVLAGNTRGGLNTDGFGIHSGKNIVVQDSVVMNQDDCVVVNSGTDMIFRNLQCYGSHGLSFSVGSKTEENAEAGIVQNITFLDSLVANGLYGIHIKTKKGSGTIRDVIYENIQLSGITEDGIYINQDYEDIGNYSREFEIHNLKISNVYGSIQGLLTRPVHVVCNENKCSNWTWSNINILGTRKSYCNYIPDGFRC